MSCGAPQTGTPGFTKDFSSYFSTKPERSANIHSFRSHVLQARQLLSWFSKWTNLLNNVGPIKRSTAIFSEDDYGSVFIKFHIGIAVCTTIAVYAGSNLLVETSGCAMQCAAFHIEWIHEEGKSRCTVINRITKGWIQYPSNVSAMEYLLQVQDYASLGAFHNVAQRTALHFVHGCTKRRRLENLTRRCQVMHSQLRDQFNWLIENFAPWTAFCLFWLMI